MVITGKGYGFVTFSTSESVEQLLEMKELPTELQLTSSVVQPE